MVYEYALVSGNIAILCISRRVHSAAIKFLYQSAFLHIHYEAPSSERLRLNGTPPVTAMPSIARHISIANMRLVQNLDICVDFDVDFIVLLACSDGALASFSRTNAPPRKTCILIRLKEFQPTIYPTKVSRILHDMSGLVNFQTLYMTASTRHVEKSHHYGWGPKGDDKYKFIIKKQLEATLGPSIWYDSKKEAGFYLEFHPLEYQKSL